MNKNNLKPKIEKWDGPLFRLIMCDEGLVWTEEPRHDLFMDAVEQQGAWMMTLSGHGYYEQGNQRHLLDKGSVLALRRPAIGSLMRDQRGGDPWRIIWVLVGNTMALDFFSYMVKQYGIIYHLPVNCSVVKRARSLIASVRKGDDLTVIEWSKKTFEFLNAWWQCARENTSSAIDIIRASKKESPLLQGSSMTIMELADRIGYSRSYLSRKLRQQWDESPGRAIRGARLEKAAYLLRTTNLPVQDIADKVGYMASTAFIRAFGKKYGNTPLGYRRKHR